MTENTTTKIYNMTHVKFIISVVFFFNLGTILNVECAVIKAAEGFERLDVDPDNTVFHENGGKLRRYTQIIRIFYVIGSPAQETIGGLQILLVHAVQIMSDGCQKYQTSTCSEFVF